MDEKEVSLKEGFTFDLIPPVLNFTGRTTELEELSKLVLRSKENERVAVVNQVTVVSGLGGIGKTQLAREYARLYQNEFNGKVLWMIAGSEDSLSLARSFRRLAEKLKLPFDDNRKNVAEAVYEHFEGENVLFIFDNAENGAWLKSYMPKVDKCANIFILITSREQEWDNGIEILHLGELSENEAISLLTKGLKVDQNEEQLKELATTLQCFPLALQQAIAYINEQQKTKQYGIENCLMEFQNKQTQLLNFNEEYTIGDPVFSTKTATTWNTTFKKIESETFGKAAIFILNIIAYLDPDKIRRDLFYQLGSISSKIGIDDANQIRNITEEQVDKAVSHLVKHSLLNGRDCQGILSVHRLVQTVTRIQLARDGKEEKSLEAAISLLNSGKDRFPLENVAHALSVWKHGWKYELLVTINAKQILQIMRTLRRAGYHDEEIQFGKDAEKEMLRISKEFGANHEHYFDIQRRIALVLNQQGRVEEAVKKLKTILKEVEAKPGKAFSELSLKIKENLGNALRSSGEYKEALELLEEVLKSKKATLKEDHKDVLKTENNIGFTYLENEQLKEAEDRFKKLLDYYSKTKGNKRRVLLLRCNLGVIHSHRGEFQKAFEAFEGVYEDLSQKWDQDVDFFALVCTYLGKSYCKLERHKKALMLLERHIEQIENRLGSKHLRTLQVRKEIGNAYAGLNEFNMARNILDNVRNGFVDLSGKDSLNELETRSDIAQVLCSSLEHEHEQEALSEFQEILQKMESLPRKMKIPLFETQRRFARALYRSGEEDQRAKDLLENAKDSMITILGEGCSAVDWIMQDIKSTKNLIQKREENRKRKATVNTDLASPTNSKRTCSDI